MRGRYHNKSEPVQVEPSSSLTSIFFACVPKPSKNVEVLDGTSRNHMPVHFTAKDTEAPKDTDWLIIWRPLNIRGSTGKDFTCRQHRTWILLGCPPHCETPAYPPAPLTRPSPTPSNPGRWRAKLLGLLQAEVMLATFAQLAVLLSDLLP